MSVPVFVMETEACRTPEPPLHVHDSHEFMLLLLGSGTQYVEDLQFPMETGELWFFSAGQRHMGSAYPSPDCHSIVVNLHAEKFLTQIGKDVVAGRVLRYLQQQAERFENKVPLSIAGIKRITKLMKTLLAEHRHQQRGFECAMCVNTQQVLLAILRDPEVPERLEQQFKPSALSKRLEGVLEFVARNYSNLITIESMAKVACISRSHFHAAFRDYVGQSPMEYVNSVRTNAATRLLQEGKLAIQEVAYACGFANLSHFYHTFKTHQGVSPGKYGQVSPSESEANGV